MNNKVLGKHGERMVEDHVIKQGYSILQSNYLKRVGEIDLIAMDQQSNEIVFIEVKTRRNRNFGYPEEAVTPKKIQKMEKTALNWLEEHGKLDNLWRIDIMSVEIGKEIHITQLKNVTL